MTQYAMILDLNKCNGCYNCFIACKDEFCGNDHLPHSLAQPLTGQFWMKIREKERGTIPKVKVTYTPVPCMQCDNAKCLELSKSGAVYRRPDGIVMIDPVKAQGQRDIVDSCPYRVIYWNEEQNVPQKCTFCAHLLDQGWKEPRCVEACPTGALVFGDLDDPESDVSLLRNSGQTESLYPEFNLKEKVRYIGLPKRFVAGTVILADREDGFAENADVTVKGEDGEKSARTDSFGDFELDGFKPDENLSVDISCNGYVSKRYTVQTRADIFLGEIVLSPEP